MPKYSRISLLAGIKRQFSSIALVEFLKGLAKIIIAGWAAYLIIRPSLDEISLMPSLSLPEVMQKIYDYSVELFFIIFIIITFIAALDYSFQRFNYLKNLRMTKQEVKDEAKQAEGSPEIKAKLKQIRMERARRRMMSSVPKATVIITNPTHYAVALYYEVTEMRAPQVVAKGVDRVALKIREIADEHKVPIVENPPLARLLYASVDLDEEIQTDHYKAVAEVISYVYKLRNKTYSLSPEK